jgi:hypothetical protein
MNRGVLRSNVLSRRSWHADVDTAFLAEVDTVCIDGAIKRLASEVPEAFIPDEERVILLPDQTHTTLSRTVSATDDPYVLSFGVVGSTNLTIVTDGTWDGLYHIEVASPDDDGVTFRYQCREFFIAGDPDTAANTYYVSLVRPWRNSTDEDMSFRLFQPHFFTRDDVTQVVDGRVYNNTQDTVLAVPAGSVRNLQSEDYQGQVVGRPVRISRWQHFQIPAPNRAPTGSSIAGSWVGPEAIGTFTYRYTYVWGRKDFQLVAPGGTYDPVWESSPSPETSAVTVASVAAVAEVTQMTNIDHMLNFDPVPALIRNGHSGLRKRIYRARTAVAAGGGNETRVEIAGIYYFLAEVNGDDPDYQDTGADVPDYFRRLPESQGYWAWAVHPHQDAAYEIDFRVYRRPPPLLSDSDAAPIHPDFEDMLEDLVLARLCELDKSPEAALVYENKFKERLLAYRAKEANPAAFVPPVPWTPYDTGYCYDRFTPYRG